MKVAILTDVLDRAERESGVPTYCRKLVESLQKQEGVDLYPTHFQKTSNSIYDNGRGIIVKSFLGKFLSIFFELPKRLKQEDIQVLHIPSPAFPDLLAVFIPGVKTVLTVHDLYCVKTKTNFPSSYIQLKRGIGRKMRILFYRLFNEKVDFFIAVSENTKKDLIEQLGIPESKIKVVHCAVDSKFKEVNAPAPDYAQRPFILAFPASIKLIKVLKKLEDKGLDYNLVLVGYISSESGKKRVKRLASKLNLGDQVRAVGFVSKEEMVKLYNNAELFVTHTTYEGFGRIPLEAMRCGCPVVASGVGSLPEVVSDGGLLVETNSREEWTEKIQKVLTDEEFKKKLIQKGYQQAEKFSWEKVAQETIEAYQKVKVM